MVSQLQNEEGDMKWLNEWMENMYLRDKDPKRNGGLGKFFIDSRRFINGEHKIWNGLHIYLSDSVRKGKNSGHIFFSYVHYRKLGKIIFLKKMQYLSRYILVFTCSLGTNAGYDIMCGADRNKKWQYLATNVPNIKPAEYLLVQNRSCSCRVWRVITC